MHTTLQKVSLDDIDLKDRTFIVTSGRDSGPLQRSIAACGLLQPPCLWRPRADAAYKIVCGYLRLKALHILGHNELDAMVFAPENPAVRLLECALQDNLSHRTFNPVEKAQALQRLLDVVPRAAIIEQWLPRFGLSPSARQLERSLCLCGLEMELQAAVTTGSLTETSALRMCSYDAKDRMGVFALMRRLHLSAGKQAELLECLEDLARRDKTSLHDVAAAEDIARICADERLNRVQKTAQVRAFLRGRRFPRLLAAEKRFATAVKDLRLDKTVRIMPPPNFEGRVFRAEIAFSSADELCRRGRQLLDAARTQSFERLCDENDTFAGTDKNCR